MVEEMFMFFRYKSCAFNCEYRIIGGQHKVFHLMNFLVNGRKESFCHWWTTQSQASKNIHSPPGNPQNIKKLKFSQIIF